MGLADAELLPDLDDQGMMLPDVLGTFLDSAQQAHAHAVLLELDLLDADSEGHALLLRPLGTELVVRLLVPAGGGGRDQVPYTDNVVEVPDIVVGLGENLDLPASRIFSENAHNTAYLVQVYDGSYGN